MCRSRHGSGTLGSYPSIDDQQRRCCSCDEGHDMSTDSFDKICLKGAPKVYKRAPGLRGRARLEQRLVRLTIELHRLARDPRSRDAGWAREWLAVLQTTRARLTRLTARTNGS